MAAPRSIGDRKNTVLLTGYQAENTLGRKLKDGWKSVRIFGIPTDVVAHIESLDELSAHADAGELLDWMESITSGLTNKLKKVFLVHGEPAQSKALAEAIGARYRIEAIPVSRGQVYDL